MSSGPFGSPIPTAQPPKAGPDEYLTVRTTNGWFLRNKRTGWIEKTTPPPTLPDLDLS